MVEYQHAQLIRGRYQLVALTHSPEYSPADVFGYAVATSEGARLTEDLSLEQARSRLQALLEQDLEAETRVDVVETHTVPRRRRR